MVRKRIKEEIEKREREYYQEAEIQSGNRKQRKKEIINMRQRYKVEIENRERKRKLHGGRDITRK